MIVINGEKYTSICKVFTSKTKAQYDANITSYGHTICVKNAYIITLVQASPLTNTSSQTCVPVCKGRISNNLAFYDEENGKELKQSDMREIYAWLDNSAPNWWLSQAQLSIDYLKNRMIASERELNSRTEFINYGGAFFNTSNFNYYNYVDSQYSPLFDDVYIGYMYTLSDGARSRLEYDIVSGVDVVASLNDLKISQSIWYNSCVLAQKLNGKIDNTIFAIDWKIYIDGKYNPTVKIKWDSEYFNFEETGNLVDTTRLLINFGGNAESIPLNWSSGSYTTNYEEMLKLVDLEWYQKYFEGLSSLFDAPLIFSSMIGGVKNGTSNITSGICFFDLTPKGTVTNSGCSEIGKKDTVTIIYGNDSGGSGGSGGDSESPSPNENDEPSSESEPISNTLSLLTTSYAMTPSRIKQLGSFLWGSSFIENIKLINNSPIENIVSCKMFPMNIASGSDSEIVLGNVSSGVNGKKIGSNNYSFRKIINGFTVSPLFGNFLDYEPYTKISIYLPFIGVKTLQPSQILGKVISLEYIVDIITGVCKCIVKSGGNQIADYDGACGIDIPITSSNRAQVELAYITSALGVVGSIAMGSPLGVVGSVLSGASSSFNSQSQGTSSPCTSIYGSLTPFLIFDRPKYTLPSSYGHTKGYVCNSHRNIGSLSGFTVCHENVDLSGIGATNEELEEIRSILTSGFYV